MTTTTINTFQDILTAIGSNPDLRHQLIQELFPDIDFARTLRELADAINAIHDRLDNVERDIRYLKTDVGVLKGKSHESDIQRNATGIFGRWVRRGHDGRNDLADAMFEAGAAADDVDEVLASDYIFTGILRGHGSISLIIESSHFAEITDIERAKTRAQLAANAGIHAYPLVTAEIWSSDMITAAEARGVIIVHGKRMNKESWNRVVKT